MSADILVAAVAIAFLAAVCQSVTAFGFALVMVPLLTLAWEAKPAVVTSTILSSLFMFPLLYEVRRRVDSAVVTPLLAGSVLGIPLGLLVLDRIDSTLLQVAVAVLVIAASLSLYYAPRVSAQRPGLALSLFTGGLSGALRAATSMAGPPVVLYALASSGDEVDRFRATVLAVLLPTSIITIAGLALSGFVDADVLLVCAASLPTMLAGTLSGRWLRGHVGPAVFRPLVLAVLLGSSLAVLLRTLADLG